VRRPTIAIALLCSLLAIGLVDGNAAVEDLARYRARVDRWQGSLVQARELSAKGDPGWREAAKRIALEAKREGKVERPGGALTISHGWLVEELEQALRAKGPSQRERALRKAEESLAFYRTSLQPAPSVGRERVREALARALPARPREHVLRVAWLGRLLERLINWLGRAFGWLERAPRSARWLVWVVITLLGAVVLFLLGLAMRAVVRRFAPEVRASGARVEVGMPWAPPDPEAVLSQARKEAATGAFGEAIRHLYLAFLLRLDGVGLLRYHPATANWEYFRGLGDDELRREFASFTVIFDRKCYGAEPAALRDYDTCEELFGRVLGLAHGT
jgi:hypothetical protein